MMWKKLKDLFGNGEEITSKDEDSEELLTEVEGKWDEELEREWDEELEEAMAGLPITGLLVAGVRNAYRLKELMAALPDGEHDLNTLDKELAMAEGLIGLPAKPRPKVEASISLQGPRPLFSMGATQVGLRLTLAAAGSLEGSGAEELRGSVSKTQEIVLGLQPPPQPMPDYILCFTEDCRMLRKLVDAGEWSGDGPELLERLGALWPDPVGIAPDTSTTSKELWQCPQCGGILQKQRETMAIKDKAGALIGTATCSYCSGSTPVSAVYAGQFDFADSDEHIRKISSDRAHMEFDEGTMRWRYKGQTVRLAPDSDE